MNTQTTCERCGKAVGSSEWDIHTCTPPAQPATEESSAVQPAAQPAPVQPIGEVIGRNEYAGLGQIKHAKTIEWFGEPAPVGTKLYTTPPAAPVQSLPFGVGGGLVAIKTLLSRDPCAHATVAIQMIDAILAEHPPQKANTP